MKKIFLASLCLLFLSGCSKKTSTETTCTITEATDSFSDVLLADNDRVISTITTALTDFSEYIESGDVTEKNLALEVESLALSMNAIDGVTYTSTLKDGVLAEETTIDYKETDMDTLIAEGLIKGDPEAYLNYLSLSETIENYESLGLTCTTVKQ